MQDIKKYLPRNLKYLLPYLEGKKLSELKISKKTIFDIFAFTKWMVTTPKIDKTWFEIVEEFIKAFGLCIVNNFSIGFMRLTRKPERIEEVKKEIWHLLGLVESLLKKINNCCKHKDFLFTTLEQLKTQSRFQYNVFKKMQRMELELDEEHKFFYLFIYNSRKWAAKCYPKLRTGDRFDIEKFRQEEIELEQLKKSQDYIEQNLLNKFNDLDKKFYQKLVQFYIRMKFEFEPNILQFSTQEPSEEILLESESKNEKYKQNDKNVPSSQYSQEKSDSEEQPGQVRQNSKDLESQETPLKILYEGSDTKSETQTSQNTDLEEGEISPPNMIYLFKPDFLLEDNQDKKIVKNITSEKSHRNTNTDTDILEEKNQHSQQNDKKIVEKKYPQIIKYQKITIGSQKDVKSESQVNIDKRREEIRQRIKKLKEIKVSNIIHPKMVLPPIKEEMVKLEEDVSVGERIIVEKLKKIQSKKKLEQPLAQIKVRNIKVEPKQKAQQKQNDY